MDPKVLFSLFVLAGPCTPGTTPSGSPDPVPLPTCPSVVDSGDAVIDAFFPETDERLEVWIAWEGCLDDTITACWAGAVDPGDPPEARLYLQHEPSGPSCGETIASTLYVDPAPIREAALAEGASAVRLVGDDAEWEWEFLFP